MSKKNINESEESRIPNDQGQEKKKEFISDRNAPLIKFCLDGETFKKEGWWNLRHTVQGGQICGEIGSGKSSGSGRKLAQALLKSGGCGIVITGNE